MIVLAWAGLVLSVQAADPGVVTSAISKVTVYSDRARVERAADVELTAGTSVWEFRTLPGWLDEESIRVDLRQAPGARIADVQVSRVHLADTPDADVRAAEAALQEMTDRAAEVEDELRILTQKEKQVETVRAFSSEQLPKETAWKGVDMAGYASVVEYVSGELGKIAAARRALERRRRDLAPELNARQNTLQDLVQRRSLQQTIIRLTIDAPGAVRAGVGLVYMLPGATWESAHEIRAVADHPERVQWRTHAIVTQTTGEDWTDAELAFSTQSPQDILEAPALEALYLGRTPSLPAGRGVSSSSFGKAKGLYLEQNRLWNAQQNDVPGDVLSGNWGGQVAAESRATELIHRLRKRGTLAHFEGLGRPAVRSDGRPVRVPIRETGLDAEGKIVAAPEKSLNASRLLNLKNTTGQPLLPGRVTLYQDGAFLGATDIDFVAENETFASVIGVADGIKLSRTMDKNNSALVRGQRTRMDVAYVVTAENLYDVPVNIELLDRIPVSRNEDIRVSRIRTQPDITPDEHGLLKWTAALEPGKTARWRIEYRVEYPAEIVRDQLRRKASDLPAAQPAEGADDAVEQLMDLESRF
ncbi:MAG: mucoidy inhibitor MuiA family protein [Kiritimatiellae bacterium]|nr:mucoidy inhibitor MuiA family protein [Kiritimatiellia bacterium]